MRDTSRRDFLRRFGLVGGGAVAGGAVLAAADRTLPLPGTHRDRSVTAAPATPANRRAHPRHSEVRVRWNVQTQRKLVALTFDDGPRPSWTPMVLDTLRDADVPATFFLVGERVRDHADILRGRTARHELGNHTWRHRDLATLDADEALDEVRRAHDVIEAVTGQEPRHLRPPYGHIGGTALLAANELGYDVALWSLQMIESEFVRDPPGLVRYIVEATLPGTILLAHDTGPADRLVALRGLPDMVRGLRAKGYEFVTVSQLVTETAELAMPAPPSRGSRPAAAAAPSYAPPPA
jgi:peptidoglycan/xylan/chitin deacetylase (PgdA/CDA1 family)